MIAVLLTMRQEVEDCIAVLVPNALGAIMSTASNAPAANRGKSARMCRSIAAEPAIAVQIRGMR